MEQKFYVCETCGNIIAMVKPSGVPVVCCGKPMKLIVPNTTDAAQEKHVPVWTREGNLVKVQVGSVAHPMVAAHYPCRPRPATSARPSLPSRPPKSPLPSPRGTRWRRSTPTATSTACGKHNHNQKGEPAMKYVCPCGYVYDPAVGDPDNGIAPGTPWEEVPADWTCPVCGLDKESFTEE